MVKSAEPPDADPHVRGCGRGESCEASPYPDSTACRAMLRGAEQTSSKIIMGFPEQEKPSRSRFPLLWMAVFTVAVIVWAAVIVWVAALRK
jgi:hypothetical protein